MQLKPASKYDLNDLHQEIDFYDRKIAYCQSYEKFDTELERSTALHKLVTKRGTLVKKAEDAVRRGIECDPKFLPRSFSGAESKAAS